MRATPSGRRISLGNEPLAGAVPLYGADGNKAAVFVGGGPVVDETKMTRPCLPVPAALLHQRCLLQPGPGEAAASESASFGPHATCLEIRTPAMI